MKNIFRGFVVRSSTIAMSILLLTSCEVPRGDNGNLTILKAGEIQVQIDPDARTPVTAANTCRAIIETCLRETTFSTDQCVTSSPVCGTDTPWNESSCCPASCIALYEEKRVAGEVSRLALRHAFGSDSSCFPGLQAALEE